MNYNNWISEDFSISEANEWMSMGFDLPQAICWTLEEISPAVAKYCVDVGLSFDQTMRWIKYGFSIEAAHAYTLCGCAHPLDAEFFTESLH